MNTKPSAKLVEMVALAIAQCDFQVTISKYVTADWPWVITVGEGYWQRHLLVGKVNRVGTDANLAILSSKESPKFGYDINFCNVDRRTTLKELIADKYSGVRDSLFPR